MTTKTSQTSKRSAVSAAPSVVAPIDRFEGRLHALYALGQKNRHLFASPLGPLPYVGKHLWVPRFAFFGPGCSDESWRLAFLAGFSRADIRASQALLGLAEFLARHAEDGYGLNLTFFPVIDVAGVTLNTPARSLESAHWGQSAEPEISALEKDARMTGYHGFIRVESAPEGDDVLTLRVREPHGMASAPDVELISSLETDPFAVRWERGAAVGATDGPLSIAPDLAVAPFELTLRVPTAWSDEEYDRVVTSVLSRFILRYRAFQAYGQHL